MSKEPVVAKFEVFAWRERGPQSGQLVSGTRINHGLPNVKETPTLHCGKR
jgi:hypothetical protein